MTTLINSNIGMFKAKVQNNTDLKVKILECDKKAFYSHTRRGLVCKSCIRLKSCENGFLYPQPDI